MDITTIVPIRAFQDNYNYIWCLRRGSAAVLVDPGDADPVLDYLSNEDLRLVAILTTLHHGDHVGGNTTLLSKYNVPVFGPALERIPGITRPLRVLHPRINLRFARAADPDNPAIAELERLRGHHLPADIRRCLPPSNPSWRQIRSCLARREPRCGHLGQSLCGSRLDESGRRVCNAAQMEGWVLVSPASARGCDALRGLP